MEKQCSSDIEFFCNSNFKQLAFMRKNLKPGIHPELGKLLLFIFLFFFTFSTNAQLISGTVSDETGKKIPRSMNTPIFLMFRTIWQMKLETDYYCGSWTDNFIALKRENLSNHFGKWLNDPYNKRNSALNCSTMIQFNFFFCFSLSLSVHKNENQLACDIPGYCFVFVMGKSMNQIKLFCLTFSTRNWQMNEPNHQKFFGIKLFSRRCRRLREKVQSLASCQGNEFRLRSFMVALQYRLHCQIY